MRYTEFTSEASGAGTKTLASPHDMPTWMGTHLFHVYEPLVIPTILQTPKYRHTVAQFWASYFGVPSDFEEAAAITEARRSVLNNDAKQFVFVIDEQALHRRIDDELTMMAQIDQLYKDSQLDNVSIGIVRAGVARSLIPPSGFWVLDRQRVCVEVPNASLEITDAPQVSLYLEMFAQLSGMAEFDKDKW